MRKKLRIDGIYDKRTLKHLKTLGLQDFCFDFSPKSFNFIQEYVFLEQILDHLQPEDRIFIRFSRSNDPMIKKLTEDLKKNGQTLKNVYFEIDEWHPDFGPLEFPHQYLLNFSADLSSPQLIGKNFRGFIFNFSFFEELHQKNVLISFARNFHTRFSMQLNSNSLMLLKIDWNHNLLATLFELFDFNLISFPINSKIEVCYRNVDLKKLTMEMDLLQKNSFLFEEAL